MKATIHPTYFTEANVSCVCGNKFTTGSTLENIKVEICSNCHPLYTGQQKLNDIQGQVEKFEKAKAISAVKKVERAKIVESRDLKQQARRSDSDRPSLKDLLIKARKS